ncbi:NUDIX hydrolase [Glycomyces sp. MUSA5-2]|uniref:NUDIX hydrolase n=1 Tax=Glycomyces sp. MUSA5-2 TaxID=2053002 RepID=UPI00300927FC
MHEQPGVIAARRSARAILIDQCDRLVLIRRVKPGQAPYWTTPGGGVEDTDVSDEAALRRELAEELGAISGPVLPVYFIRTTEGNRVGTQRFFLTRLKALDELKRSGSEFLDPARGAYLVDRITLSSDALADVELRPQTLHQFLLENHAGLLAELMRLEQEPTTARPDVQTST